MAHSTTEIDKFFGRCKCCLSYTYLKRMWEEHEHPVDGGLEMYGKMIEDCFVISWTVTNNKEADKICEECVTKLREAIRFKTMVLQSQELMLKESTEDTKIPECEIEIKQEVEECYKDVQYLDEEMIEEDNQIEENTKATECETDIKEELEDLNCYKDVQYLDEEMIEEDDQDNDESEDYQPEPEKVIFPQKKMARIGRSYRQYSRETFMKALEAIRSREITLTQASEQHSIPIRTLSKALRESRLGYKPLSKKVQRTKNLPRSERYPKYRQYSRETLMEAVESVSSNKMTLKQASEKYNVPGRMISRTIKEGPPENLYSTEMIKYMNEVKTILFHTNAIPFKSKGNDFKCIFCPHNTTSFRDPQELRSHTCIEHKDRSERVEFVMRPFNAFEMLRLDVKGLICNCGTKLKWSEMILHLKTHDPTFVPTEKRIVPYQLNTKELTCAICHYKSCYTLMDVHMNTHFKNHICGDCGDTFITASRLQKHRKCHDTGIYPCNYCDRLFARDIYRKKHTNFVHPVKKVTVFKCKHCNERFPTETDLCNHVEEHHNEIVQTYMTCEVCNKRFSSNYYKIHEKRCKGILEYKCDKCDKTFERQKLLDEHKLRHSDVRSFQCDICFSSYFSPAAVIMHKNYKHNEMVSMLRSGRQKNN